VLEKVPGCYVERKLNKRIGFTGRRPYGKSGATAATVLQPYCERSADQLALMVMEGVMP